MMERISEASPRLKARIAGALFLLADKSGSRLEMVKDGVALIEHIRRLCAPKCLAAKRF